MSADGELFIITKDKDANLSCSLQTSTCDLPNFSVSNIHNSISSLYIQISVSVYLWVFDGFALFFILKGALCSGKIKRNRKRSGGLSPILTVRPSANRSFLDSVFTLIKRQGWTKPSLNFLLALIV